MTVICLLLLPASEWTGFGRGMASFLVGPKRAVQNASASGFMKANPELARRLSAPMPYHLSGTPRPAVWWPGWVWLAGSVIVLGRKGRQDILSKLDRIRLDEVQYDLPLTEVCNLLRVESQKRDPDGVGINFLLNPRADAAEGAFSPTDTTGNVPAGAVAVAGPAPTLDMGTVTIKISPSLSNLRLVDVLNAIVMRADQPIKYTVEDYGVVFSSKPAEAVTLHAKTFHVDPTPLCKVFSSTAPTSTSANPVEAPGLRWMMALIAQAMVTMILEAQAVILRFAFIL